MRSSRTIPAHEAFTATGYPESNYVNRGTYADEITRFLQQKAPGILTIVGPSRTGKTVLLNYCLRLTKVKSIRFNGGAIRTREDFLDTLANEIGIDSSQRVDDKMSVAVNLGFVTGSLESGESRGTRQNIVERLTKDRVVLVIDDFHRIPRNVRAEILDLVKALMELTDTQQQRAVKVILVYIPTREISRDRRWGELNERITLVSLPLWEIRDLVRITARRFDSAGAALIGLQRMAEECYGLPSVMQKYCLEYFNIYKDGRIPRNAAITVKSEELHAVYEKVGGDIWKLGARYKYDELVDHESSQARWRVTLRSNGRSVSIGQIILYSIVAQGYSPRHSIIDRIGDYFEIDALTIVDRIVRLAQNAENQQDFIIDNIFSMSQHAEDVYTQKVEEKQDPADPILDYEKRRGVLRVYDPSFLVALRHAREHTMLFTGIRPS
jgi:uncharacterized protein (UPF0147 family)